MKKLLITLVMVAVMTLNGSVLANDDGIDDVIQALTPDHPEYEYKLYRIKDMSDSDITGVSEITGETLTIKVNGIHHPILFSIGDEIVVITNPLNNNEIMEVLETDAD